MGYYGYSSEKNTGGRIMQVLYNDWDMIYKLWCPHCDQCLELGHMNWNAILCEFCNKQIDNKEE